MMKLLDIMNRNKQKAYSKAGEKRDIICDDVAAAGLILAFVLNILPLLFFFIAFMFVIANIMQIAIAILIAGIGIVMIRWALRGAGKYLRKVKRRDMDEGNPYYGYG